MIKQTSKKKKNPKGINSTGEKWLRKHLLSPHWGSTLKGDCQSTVFTKENWNCVGVASVLFFQGIAWTTKAFLGSHAICAHNQMWPTPPRPGSHHTDGLKTPSPSSSPATFRTVSSRLGPSQTLKVKHKLWGDPVPSAWGLRPPTHGIPAKVTGKHQELKRERVREIDGLFLLWKTWNWSYRDWSNDVNFFSSLNMPCKTYVWGFTYVLKPIKCEI